MYFQPVTIGFEPPPYVCILVVRSVVLNQDCSSAAIAAGELFQESQVG
jgi:hypothetical protein